MTRPHPSEFLLKFCTEWSLEIGGGSNFALDLEQAAEIWLDCPQSRQSREHESTFGDSFFA
jgi:hypothetical protein